MHFEEYDAFVHFSVLMTSKSLMDIFRLKNVKDKFERFDNMLKLNDLEVYNYFGKQGISSSGFLLDWLLTLFSKCLNPDKVSRVWDMLFVQGSQVLWKTAVGVIMEIRGHLLKSGMEDIYKILKNVDKYIESENELVDKISKVTLEFN